MDNDKYADDKGHITQSGKALMTALPAGRPSQHPSDAPARFILTYYN